jgi:Tfp pilus assembly protein PilF
MFLSIGFLSRFLLNLTMFTSSIFQKFLLFSTAVFLTGFLSWGQEARITEEPVTYTTYPFSDPSPVPSLAYKRDIYPYFKFEGYSVDPVNKEWNRVTLENEFLKVTIMPEIGGRVWGAVEKSTGFDFIYENEVVKFRNIAMRGPWTSGGIEFNFGIIGHAPSTASPVDFITYENEDGSLTCVVGTMDLPSRTQWRVKINLPKDKAYFETEGLWYNPEPLRQPYYNWMTAAAHVGDDQEFFYPGHIALQHSGALMDWPVQDGIDVSLYDNNAFGSSKSHHMAGSFQNHFGGYFHDQGYGFGHFSSYDDMPGKKLWLWALSRSGGIWEDLLTDENGQYMEFQAGRMLNQFSPSSRQPSPLSKAGFAPYTVDRWTDYWFPVKQIGGISAVSQKGVFHLKEENQTLSLSFNPFENIQEDLQVHINGNLAQSISISGEPMDVITKKLDLDAPLEKLELVLGTETVYSWATEDPMKLSRSFDKDKAAPLSEIEKLYYSARQDYYSRAYPEAQSKYEDILRKEPGHQQANIDYAELLFRFGRYEEALKQIVQPLATDFFDPQANFVAGGIYRAMGQPIDALEAYGWAARSMEFRSSAYTAMAEIHLAQNNVGRAADYAQKALDFNVYNIMALQVLAVKHRLAEEEQQAAEVLQQLWDIDPLNHFIRFEQYLKDPKPGTLEAFHSLINNEFPYQTHLELAATYLKYNRKSEALQVLEQSPEHALVDLWTASLDEKQQESGLDVLLAKPIAFVLPYRKETLQMLQQAREKRAHWKLDYYLALNLMAFNETEEPAKLMNEIDEKADEATFYLNRALLLEKIGGKDPLADLKKAWEMDPSQWRHWQHLARYQAENGQEQEALSLLKKATRTFSGSYVLEMDYIRVLNSLGQYKKAMDLLDKINVLPYEGAGEGRALFETVYLNAALEDMQGRRWKSAQAKLEKSLEWPENLGVGKPFSTNETMQNYLLGQVAKAQNQQDLFRSHMQRVVADTKDLSIHRPEQLLGLFALEALGESEEASALWEEIKSEGDEETVTLISRLYEHGGQQKKSESGNRREALLEKIAGIRWSLR